MLTLKSDLLDSRRNQIIALGTLSFIAVCALLYAFAKGPGVSQDPSNYASAAESFASGNKFIDSAGKTITVWPLGLPVLLGLLIKAGLTIETAAMFVNLVCAIIAILLTYFIARKFSSSNQLAILVTAFFALSLSTLEIFQILNTEVPFICLTLLALSLMILLEPQRSTPQIVLLIIGIAGAISLATSFRLIGLSLIPAGLMAAWTITSRFTIAKRLSVLGIFLGLSVLGVLAFFARNISLGYDPFGERLSNAQFGANIKGVVYGTWLTLAKYVIPTNFSQSNIAPGIGNYAEPSLLTYPLLLLGLVIMIALCLAIISSLRYSSAQLRPIAIYVSTYWAFLIYSELTTDVDQVNTRLLSPVFVPMLILFALWIMEQSKTIDDSNLRKMLSFLKTGRVTIPILFVLFVLQIFGSISFLNVAHTEGIGYNNDVFQNSQLLKQVQDAPAEQVVLSYGTESVYWVTKRRTETLWPEGNFANETVLAETQATKIVSSTTATSSPYLVYQYAEISKELVQALKTRNISVTVLGKYPDGYLYQAKLVP